MSGYMKKFPGASHHLEDGNTNVLPTWLGYTHEKYDPLTDPPYRSAEDIFGGKMNEAAEDCSHCSYCSLDACMDRKPLRSRWTQRLEAIGSYR